MKTKKRKVMADQGSSFREKFCNRSKFLYKVEKKFIWSEKLFYYKFLLEKHSDWKDWTVSGTGVFL